MSKPKSDKQTFLFAFIVLAVCSMLLSATAAALRDRQQRMVEFDRKRNVLLAFGVEIRHEDGTRFTPEDVDRVVEQNIREVIIDAETAEIIPGLTRADVDPRHIRNKIKLPLYLWEENGDVRRYAFPISGYGLWSTIYGYIALETDLATIAGITFYEHGETPGLGAEIERPWFREQFKGKVLYQDGEPVEFKVAKGRADVQYPDRIDHAVDGISGATFTGQGVAEFITRDFKLYNRFFENIRNQ